MEEKKDLIYNKEVIENLYREIGTVAGVAKEFGKSYNTMKYWFKKFDIPFTTNKSLFYELKESSLSEHCKSMIIGSLLGDGYIEMTAHSNKNARLCVANCERQLPYLHWKCKELKPFSTKVKLQSKATKKVYKHRTFISTSMYYFRTVSHPDLAKLRTMFYNFNKIKTITEDNIKGLDLLAVLVWYCDDGSLHIDKRDGSLYINMATNGFSYNEQLILIESLSKFFNGSINTYQHSDKDRNDYYIRMYGTKFILKFLRDLSSIAIPRSMEYKLNPQRLGVKPLLE